MKHMKILSTVLLMIFFMTCSCSNKQDDNETETIIFIEAENFNDKYGNISVESSERGERCVISDSMGDWLGFEVKVLVAGRYKCEVKVSSKESSSPVIWIEDYYDNKDGRTYNITSSMNVPKTNATEFVTISKYGSPLNTGVHKIRFHFEDSGICVDWIKFTLIKKHQITPEVLTQNTDGNDWNLVWSDEFNGSGLPDTTKWTFDFGNWGWGNNEPQFYTEFRQENARLENGNLIVEARKKDMDQPWTSARLTTRGKVSFVYGKIEFRAMVPVGDGTWAAGWLLGEAYLDEISWPYCGEIDVLECVGKEIDEKGAGINHASCHTRAFYFKQGNHLTSTIPVNNMHDQFHVYSIEWYNDRIDAFVDGVKYYTYDKTNGEWEWPFNSPQNIIINLAMGGGMGGQIDENIISQKLTVDYIRVYEKI